MNLFQFIKAKVSIISVIEEYVSLKPAGSYLKGTCPFHSETDASFTVSPERGIYYCFGCHASGDVIGFIAQKENMSQKEAAFHLIEHFNLSVPDNLLSGESPSKNMQLQHSHHSLCGAIEKWAHKALLQSSIAKTYLKERQISEKMVEQFSLGYIPGGLKSIHNLVNDLSRQSILLKDISESGFVVQNGAILYSPFEERIIFPIRDHLGRTCGFGGRIYRPNDERAKYYNSKESPHFQKGTLLFGLDQAKNSIRQTNEVFLVEGYVDCIAMVQASYQNTVATLGTACTLEHLHLLSRYAQTAYILYDGDKAGEQAVLRLADLAWQANIELKIISLPPKEDPASFLSKASNLEPLKKAARSIFSFFIGTQARNFSSKPLAEKLSVSEKIINLISTLNDPLKEDLLLLEAATTLTIPFETLKAKIKTSKNEHQIQKIDSEKEEKTDEIEEEETNALEKKIVCAIINGTKPMEGMIEKDLLPYFSKRARLILELYSTASEHHKPHERFTLVYEQLNVEDRAWMHSVSFGEADSNSEPMLKHYLRLFRKYKWKRALHDIKKHMLEAHQQGDVHTLAQLSDHLMKLKQEMKSRGLI